MPKKAKGPKIEPTSLRLNFETRWFEVVGSEMASRAEPPSAQEIAAYIESVREATTGQVTQYFEERGGERTIRTRLNAAESLGLIWKLNKQSPWKPAKIDNYDSPDPRITFQDQQLMENGKSATPIELPITDSSELQEFEL